MVSTIVTSPGGGRDTTTGPSASGPTAAGCSLSNKRTGSMMEMVSATGELPRNWREHVREIATRQGHPGGGGR